MRSRRTEAALHNHRYRKDRQHEMRTMHRPTDLGVTGRSTGASNCPIKVVDADLRRLIDEAVQARESRA